MDFQEKSKQFFEQIKNKPITASVIDNAARATGYAPELISIYLGFAEANGIDVQKELTVLAADGKKAEAKKTEQERRADIKAVIGKMRDRLTSLDAAIETTPLEDLIVNLTNINAEAAGLNCVKPKIITSKELMQTQYPPRKWIVENLIGPGLTIFFGPSKIGKSWLLFALTEAASTGGKFLDYYTVNKTSVLHISLEDDERNIKERRGILANKQEGFTGNDDLFFNTKWEGGLSGLENHLRTNPEIKFVIIDTLGLFMPEIEDMNDYAPAIKALSKIKKMADSLDIAILAVHHAKKGNSKESQGDWMDQSLGSQGIVASADTIIILKREINTKTGERLNTGKFYATGRNIKDVFHKVEFFPDFGIWDITDNPILSVIQKQPMMPL
ncbi:MAG: helicase RepA family protein [Treponema sp.]|jgi:hypothetical protein|nr:helicase RepA family protein [Treponema sp.]